MSDAQDFGGAEVSMVLLTNALRDRYDFIAILSDAAPEETRRRLVASGAQVRTIAGLQRRPRLRTMWELLATLRQVNPDLVNINLTDQGDALGALLACRASRVPTIATLRNVIPNRSAAKERLSRLGLSCADVVIAPSDFVAGYASNAGAATVATVKNGSPPPELLPDARAHLGTPPGRFVVGGIGRLHKQKGWDILCRAAAIVHRDRPDIEFVVVGGGPERESLLALPSCRQVRFVGYRESAASFLGAFDLVAIPSRYEAFGRVAVEAMLANVPVVASRVGGLPEVVGDEGVLVAPEDAVGLARAILELERDPARRSELVEAGRRRAESLFTVERMADETAAIFDSMVVSRRPRVAVVSGAKEFAGAEAALLALVELLRSRYDFVAILSDGAAEETARRLGAIGVETRMCPGLSRRPTVLGVARLAHVIRDVDPQIVHVNMSDQGDGLTPLIAARLTRRRVVATVHNIIPGRKRHLEFIARLALMCVDAVIAVSDFVGSYMREIGVGASVVKNAVRRGEIDRNARAALGLSPSAPVVGGIGRLHHQKGWDVFCRAASLVHAEMPKVEFIVIGEGPERNALEALPDCDRVRFLGYRESAARLLGAFDVLVMPSRYEGFGIAAIEAMHAGVPVIASRVGGLPEVLGESAGVLVPPELPEILAREIVRLLRDPGRRLRLAEEGRRRAAAELSRDDFEASIHAVYQPLCTTPTRRLPRAEAAIG